MNLIVNANICQYMNGSLSNVGNILLPKNWTGVLFGVLFRRQITHLSGQSRPCEETILQKQDLAKTLIWVHAFMFEEKQLHFLARPNVNRLNLINQYLRASGEERKVRKGGQGRETLLKRCGRGSAFSWHSEDAYPSLSYSISCINSPPVG